jgi:hypothetical protein
MKWHYIWRETITTNCTLPWQNWRCWCKRVKSHFPSLSIGIIIHFWNSTRLEYELNRHLRCLVIHHAKSVIPAIMTLLFLSFISFPMSTARFGIRANLFLGSCITRDTRVKSQRWKPSMWPAHWTWIAHYWTWIARYSCHAWIMTSDTWHVKNDIICNISHKKYMRLVKSLCIRKTPYWSVCHRFNEILLYLPLRKCLLGGD